MIARRVLLLLGLALVARRELFLRRRAHEDYSAVDAYALVEIGLVALIAVILAATPKHLRSISNAPTSLRLLLTYLIFGCLTAFWSSNPPYSAFLAFEFGSQVALILALVTATPQAARERTVVSAAMWATIITCSFTISLYGFSGSWMQYKSNSGGACAAMLGTYCIIQYVARPSDRRRLKVPLVVALFGVALTTSAASFISLAFGVASALWYLDRGRTIILALAAASAVLALLHPSEAFQLIFTDKDPEQVRTLHGRTIFWEVSRAHFEAQPLEGHGYGMAAKLGGYASTNLHNSAFSILLGTGLAGAAIFATALLRLLIDTSRSRRYRTPGAIGATAALSTGALNCLSISFFGEDWRGPTFVFLAFWTLVALRTNPNVEDY